MRVHCVLVIALLTGCFYHPTNEEVPPPEGQQEAIEIIWDFFQSEMGPLRYPELDIRWYAGSCLQGRVVKDFEFCITGLYYGTTTHGPEIFLIEFQSIHVSALAHELVHFWQDTRGDSDTEHKKDEWWDLVEPANDLVREWECKTYPGTDRCPDMCSVVPYVDRRIRDLDLSPEEVREVISK